ncbi:hypothetical protein CCHL11_03235 [Colletotrichum chlorophyti]|uniref:Uncharacterized protein n=1 Tax=Colletotrichum chlorophyti TaxID=708187 RepID=A0A1Q8S405_9PEZI|nr:hypothetical protein CCHL11_03235 [Colletotrichum chlorophyti]
MASTQAHRITDNHGQRNQNVDSNADINAYLAGVSDVQVELDRLRIQHCWIQTCLNERIAFAPVDLKKPGIKVLDVGCADGTLLRDLRKQVPSSAELVGADLSVEFLPKTAEGNICYLKQDVCDPPAAELRSAFDFTHVRNVLHSAQRSGIEKAVANLADTLAPGGWLQVMELNATPDGTKQPQALQDFVRLLGAMIESAGMDSAYAERIPAAFKKAGLQNVTIERVECGIGRVHADEAIAKSSIEPFIRILPMFHRNFQAVAATLPPSVYKDIKERYVKEMTEQGGYSLSYVIYGQKPA